MKKTIIAALAATAIVAALAVPGFVSAKRGGHNAAALTGEMSINDSTPTLGEVVSFTVTYPGTAKAPLVSVVCSQGGTPVFSSVVPATDAQVLLGGMSSNWLETGGAADCEATLFEWDWKPVQTPIVYASMSFQAEG